jgi:hypothetical protein
LATGEEDKCGKEAKLSEKAVRLYIIFTAMQIGFLSIKKN